MNDQEKQDTIALAEIAARKLHGTFLRPDESGERGVIVYRCGHCGKEHRAYIELSIMLLDSKRSEERTAIPDVFHRTFEEEA